VTVLTLMMVLAAACSSTSGASSGSDGSGTAAVASRSAAPVVDISVSHCGRGWAGGPAGRLSFSLHDSDSRAAEVTLVDPATGGVYAALEPLGAGRTAAMTVKLGPGSYAFRCAMEDEPVVSGPSVVVRGTQPADAALAVLPVTAQDLLPATRAYTAYVAGRLPVLLRDVGRLRTELRRKDRGGAERDWLTAHLAYERLGAAYGAFGDADGAINGLPSGLPKGLQDKGFTGFHRIEQDLWHGRSFSTLEAETAALSGQVARLRTSFASAQIDPLEVSIRAHEITENALQLELTGRTDFGSHSSLATIGANLAGTRTLMDILRPLLRPRYASLDQAMSTLARAQADVAAQRRDGRWVALQSLSQPSRERIDADLSELSERLAPVAAILEPRRDT
jgi:iron uptake system component EfeO